MNKIKVCFVETNCKKNGPIKQTLNIIEHMDRDIFHPMLITIWNEENNNSMLDEYKKLGVETYCLGLTKKTSVFLGSYNVTKLLKNLKPVIVHAVGMPPYRMTLGYRNTLHFTTLRNYCYEDYPDQYGKVLGSVMAELDMRLIREKIAKGERFVTCSESLTKMYNDRQGIRIPFIRNGVNVSQYRMRKLEERNTLRKKLSLPQDKLILVYSGGLIDRKNQKECIEGFLKSRLSYKACLLLLGDGVDFNTLHSKYSNNERIIFAGKVSNVEDYLHASDVYLSTSKSEGLPNGVLEAMACGIPILLSDILQHQEVLEADLRCGLSYHLGDINDLSQKIDAILSKDLVEMGEYAYEAVMNNFTAEIMSKKYQDLYMQMLAKN